MLTESQIAERLNFVTGSDASVICGLSPWKTKLQLWMEKTGRAIQDDISNLNHIKFGNYFEQGVADWFEAESGKKLKPMSTSSMLVHKEHDWMAGNVDRFLLDENAILECKTAFRDDGWGNGENFIPPHYLMQVAHYCAVGGFDRAYVAVVFAAQREMRWYQYDRNLELEQKLIAREKAFWFDNVKADVAPEPANTEDVLMFYTSLKMSPMIAPKDIEEKVYQLKQLKSKGRELTHEAESLQEQIELIMQDHQTLLDVNGQPLATWAYTKPVKRFDTKKFEKEFPDVFAEYLGNKPDRRFIIKVKGEA